MTRNEITRRFPKASEAFIRANLGNHNPEIRSAVEKSVERMPLDSAGEAEGQNWYDAAKCFEIEFVVYSVRPADYDGYDIKALQDFCVKIGIIPEDRWDVIVGGTVRSRKVATEEEEKTVVQIKAIQNPEAAIVEVFQL